MNQNESIKQEQPPVSEASDFDPLVSLPLYKSNATPEQKEQKLAWMAKQLRLIREQEQDGIPVTRVKIRCGCGRLHRWMDMYRCLYCGIWYCRECAQLHFGARAPEPYADIKQAG